MSAREPLFTRNFILCGLATFTQAVIYELFLHFPGFARQLGAGETLIGVLYSLTAIATLAAGPTIGRSMDLRGRRIVILTGNTLNMAVVGLYLLVESLSPWLFGLRMLHGLSQAMLYAALFTYAADLIPRSRTAEGLALFGTTAMLAVAVGTVLGDIALARGGFTTLFQWAVVGAVLAFLIALPLPESRHAAKPEDEPPRRWRETLLQPDLLPIWLVTGAFFFSMTGIVTFMKTFLMDTGITQLGVFFTIYSLTAIALRVLLGKVPDRLGLERVVVPSLLAYAAGLLLAGSAQVLWHVVVVALLCGLGHGYSFPILLGLVSQRARDAERGSAMAIYTMIDEGALLIAAPFLGFVIESMGYAVMFRVAGGFLVVSVAVFLFWDRR